MNDYSPTFLSADNRHSAPGIRQVIDLEAIDPQQTIVAKDFLTTLDAEGVTNLRRSIFRHRSAGAPRYVCSYCREPVHVRVTSVAESGVTDGRRATFVHDPRGTLRDCPYGNFSGESSPALIDGLRFSGRQEGARHKHLKGQICEMLKSDPKVASAEVEVLVTGRTPEGDRTWRRPDVLAVTTDGRQLAFDVQLAPPLLATISGRENFYRTQGVAWHWVVDADRLDLLQLQGFQDFCLPQASRVLGFNDAIASVVKNDKQTSFHLLRIIPSDDHPHFRVQTKTIGLESTLSYAGFPSGGPARHATDLRALGFFNAIYMSDHVRAGRIFDLMAVSCGAPGWTAACRDHLPTAITALVTLVGARDVAIEYSHLKTLLTANQTRNSAGISPWSWVFLIVALARTDLVLRDRIAACGQDTLALMQVAVAESEANPTASQQLQATWGRMLHRLFPRLTC